MCWTLLCLCRSRFLRDVWIRTQRVEPYSKGAHYTNLATHTSYLVIPVLKHFIKFFLTLSGLFFRKCIFSWHLWRGNKTTTIFGLLDVFWKSWGKKYGTPLAVLVLLKLSYKSLKTIPLYAVISSLFLSLLAQSLAICTCCCWCCVFCCHLSLVLHISSHVVRRLPYGRHFDNGRRQHWLSSVQAYNPICQLSFLLSLVPFRLIPSSFFSP